MLPTSSDRSLWMQYNGSRWLFNAGKTVIWLTHTFLAKRTRLATYPTDMPDRVTCFSLRGTTGHASLMLCLRKQVSVAQCLDRWFTVSHIMIQVAYDNRNNQLTTCIRNTSCIFGMLFQAGAVHYIVGQCKSSQPSCVPSCCIIPFPLQKAKLHPSIQYFRVKNPQHRLLVVAKPSDDSQVSFAGSTEAEHTHIIVFAVY